jgi:hypothetical protein
MTAPPGGPYGQDPYGTNPYGQGPHWGGQPQGPYGGSVGQPQGGGGYPYPPPGGAGYPYPPPGGPHPDPQGGGYPYPPPGGPYPDPQGGQSPSGPYPYPPTGGPYPYPPPYPPPTGPYPPGPPPNGPSSRLPWLIVAGLAVLGVIALVATLMVTLGGNDNKSSKPAPSSTTTSPSQPKGSAQNATECTPNVSGGEKPTGTTVLAGQLSFPASAAPGWMPFSDDQTPNLIGAVGVAQEVPGANQWVMQAEVAMTNFVASMDLTAQASKLMNCVADGPGYQNASPTLGPTKKSSITVDGIKAARVDADVTIADPARNVKGDSVTIIAVDTKPVTIFLGATPLGDKASAGILNQVIGSLKVAK